MDMLRLVHMAHRIRPLQTAAIILIYILLWACLTAVVARRKGLAAVHRAGLLMLLAGTAMVVAATLLRSPWGSTGRTMWIPFAPLFGIRRSRDYVRLLALNVLLFVPFGSGLACVLERRVRRPLLLCTLIAAGLSALVETLQYLVSSGMCEVDDLICNTFGGWLGALTIPLSHAMGWDEAEEKTKS